MELVCPKCNAAIAPASVNVAADLAQCGECGEVFKASELIQTVHRASDLAQPKGSRIRFEQERADEGRLLIPRRSLRVNDAFVCFMAVFMTGFMTFWTWGAAHAGGAFALFSAPFWLFIVILVGGWVNSLAERTVVELGPDGLHVCKRRPFFPRHHVMAYADIDAVAVEKVTSQNPVFVARHVNPFAPYSLLGGVSMPTVTYGTRKVHFADAVSEPEMEWLVKLLRATVHARTGKVV